MYDIIITFVLLISIFKYYELKKTYTKKLNIFKHQNKELLIKNEDLIEENTFLQKQIKQINKQFGTNLFETSKYVSETEKLAEQEHIEILTNTKRFKNIMAFAQDTISISDEQNAFWLIKMLCEQLTIQNSFDLISSISTDDIQQKDVNKIYRYKIDIDENIDDKYKLGERISKDMKIVKEFNSFIIDLGTDPILNSIWKKISFKNTLNEIGVDGNEWLEDDNHKVEIYLPMGVAVALNGKHSTTVGMVKNIGTLNVTPNSKHGIIDISKLYDYIAFDGEHFVYSEENIIIEDKPIFEIGCIYEIGRLIHLQNIMYKGINYKEKPN